MASATIGIGNHGFVVDHVAVGKRKTEARCNEQLVAIGHRRSLKCRISARTASLEPMRNGRHKDGRDRLDEWMKNSVEEIVKNLREAPLLVQVYPDGGALRTEKAMVDDWPELVEKWEKGETPLPEGVILVEELGDEGHQGEERTTKAWGLVVQGRGVGTGPICYLLKTSRVKSGPGLSPFCTHFCLVRVKSFRETVESQLKNCWLLQCQAP